MGDHSAVNYEETDIVDKTTDQAHADNGWIEPDDGTVETFDGDDADAVDATVATVETAVPTQLVNPGKATARTGLAVVISGILSLLVIAPAIIEVISGVEGLPEWVYPSLLSIGGTITAISLVITRLMQIPQINELLAKIGFGTGAE